MSSNDPLMLEGQVLDGTYRIDAMVGEGGFGVVYRAYHLGFRQPIAVKCLKIPGMLGPEVREAFLAKFNEESRMLFQLSMGTLGIVRSIAVGSTTTPSGIWAPYFVLEWLDGESLEQVLNTRRTQGFRGRSLHETVRLLDGPAQALSFAHGQRIAHRDIKPANLFVLRDGKSVSGGVPTIKLLDFGIAKTMEQNQSAVGKALTALGFSAFSPGYAAPEQVDTRIGPTGQWSDVYSFAVVMVEVLTDRCAVESTDRVSMMWEILNTSARPTPRTKGLAVDQRVEDVFLRALQVNPAHRFQNMGDFWTALSAAVQGSAVSPTGGANAGYPTPAPMSAQGHGMQMAPHMSAQGYGMQMAPQMLAQGYGMQVAPQMSMPSMPGQGMQMAPAQSAGYGTPAQPTRAPMQSAGYGTPPQPARAPMQSAGYGTPPQPTRAPMQSAGYGAPPPSIAAPLPANPAVRIPSAPPGRPGRAKQGSKSGNLRVPLIIAAVVLGCGMLGGLVCVCKNFGTEDKEEFEPIAFGSGKDASSSSESSASLDVPSSSVGLNNAGISGEHDKSGESGGAPSSTSSLISAGMAHTCGIASGGKLLCWGFNGNGELGDGTTTKRYSPTPVQGLESGVTAVSATWNHTCAVTSSGGVMCWGKNDYGQLGDNTTTARKVPTQVSGLTSDVVAVSAGWGHTCALTSRGAVLCWGRNGGGQLGNGSTSTSKVPTPVLGISSGAKAVAAGAYSTCAITSSGGVSCWGNNADGELGDGTTTKRTVPTQVSGLSDVTSIAINNTHTCAVTSTGQLLCWGNNLNGQLGNGSTALKTSPTQVSGFASGVAAVSAGHFHVCALTLAGSVHCWGANVDGRVGDDTASERTVPTQVSGLTSGVVAISAFVHSCALKASGQMVCWGNNGYGQLGDGSTGAHRVPGNVVDFSR